MGDSSLTREARTNKVAFKVEHNNRTCVCIVSLPGVLGHLHHKFGHPASRFNHDVVLPLLGITIQLVCGKLTPNNNVQYKQN